MGAPSFPNLDPVNGFNLSGLESNLALEARAYNLVDWLGVFF